MKIILMLLILSMLLVSGCQPDFMIFKTECKMEESSCFFDVEHTIDYCTFEEVCHEEQVDEIEIYSTNECLGEGNRCYWINNTHLKSVILVSDLTEEWLDSKCEKGIKNYFYRFWSCEKNITVWKR